MLSIPWISKKNSEKHSESWVVRVALDPTCHKISSQIPKLYYSLWVSGNVWKLETSSKLTENMDSHAHCDFLGTPSKPSGRKLSKPLEASFTVKVLVSIEYSIEKVLPRMNICPCVAVFDPFRPSTGCITCGLARFGLRTSTILSKPARSGPNASVDWKMVISNIQDGINIYSML